jgi:hypothetical protein
MMPPFTSPTSFKKNKQLFKKKQTGGNFGISQTHFCDLSEKCSGQWPLGVVADQIDVTDSNFDLGLLLAFC